MVQLIHAVLKYKATVGEHRPITCRNKALNMEIIKVKGMHNFKKLTNKSNSILPLYQSSSLHSRSPFLSFSYLTSIILSYLFHQLYLLSVIVSPSSSLSLSFSISPCTHVSVNFIVKPNLSPSTFHAMDAIIYILLVCTKVTSYQMVPPILIKFKSQGLYKDDRFWLF